MDPAEFARALTSGNNYGSRTWRNRAACRDYGADVFFPSSTAPTATAEAVEICRGCPVRRECVVEEIEVVPRAGQQQGVRGLTPTDRQALIRWMNAEEIPARHLTAADIDTHDSAHDQPLEETA